MRRTLGASKDDSLSELLIGSYLAWGPTFPDRLRGDFAIVLWDGRRQQLVAARDPFGIRPLAYRGANRRIWIASQVEQLLRTVDGSPVIDDDLVVQHLLWKFKASDSTFFREIRYVRAGHVTVMKASGIEDRRYWYPSRHLPTKNEPTKEEYNDEVRRLFVQAVRRRLCGNKPVVVHVSGGLDSSSIAVAADSLLKTSAVQASSVLGAAGLYPNLRCDESPFIDAVERQVSFPIERWDASDVEATDFDDPMIERPGSRGSFIGGSRGDLAIAQKYGASVVLSGMGGDELMTPAGIVQDALAARNLRLAVKDLLFFEGATMRSRFSRAKYVTRESTPFGIRRFVAKMRAGIPNWLAADWRSLAREIAAPHNPDLEFVSHVQAQKWLRVNSPDMMRPIEIAQCCASSMGIQYEFPFLDRDLVEFVIQIPYDVWPRPAVYARLHREALRSLLPEGIANRYGKAEFTVALENGLRGAEAAIHDLLYGPRWLAEKYVNRSAVRVLWNTMTRRGYVPARGWRDLWSALTLEAWMRKISRYHPPN